MTSHPILVDKLESVHKRAIHQLSIHERSVFESKKQGYPYHLNVLAIACLIEYRYPHYVKQHFINQFKQYSVYLVGFKDLLADYLDLGYSLEEACDSCVLDENGCSFDPIAFMETLLALVWDKKADKVDSTIQFAAKNPMSQDPDTIPSLFGKVIFKRPVIERT